MKTGKITLPCQCVRFRMDAIIVKRRVADLQAEIIRLKTELEDLHDEHTNSMKFIMDDCDAEIHCACVPILRTEITKIAGDLYMP